MATIVAILGASGDGKTTSTMINPDGSFDLENYQGMDPKSHFILNLDRKTLPFPDGWWGAQQHNYAETSDFTCPKGAPVSAWGIKQWLEWAAKQENIKSIAIDTINIYLSMKEFNDRKKLTFDQWRDIANDIIELNTLCNTILRKDQIVYIMGHTMLQTQPDGTEKTVFSIIGKKLTKVSPEGFYPIVLMTRVEYGSNGDNQYFFQTKANHSSAKTPLGMFSSFEIPNSLKLVDDTIRKYYGLNKE